MRILIVGCGYVGLAVARRLTAAGHAVAGLRRSAEGTAELRGIGVEPLVGDLTQVDDLRRLPGPFDAIVNTVSSSRGGAADYREVYLGGARNLVAVFGGTGLRALVNVGSTSVYAQTDGGWVSEESPTLPTTATGRVLVETEEELWAAAKTGFPAVLLRVGGIYGPGRGHLFSQFLRGEARVSGDGSRWLNMIHREDVAGAIQVALERGRPGEVYNVVDDEPVSQGAFLRWLADQTGRPFPSTATGAEDATRKRGLTHKRVSNRKLRGELGWSPDHPTFREGYGPLMAGARSAGNRIG